jgi:hypothetical protein
MPLPPKRGSVLDSFALRSGPGGMSSISATEFQPVHAARKRAVLVDTVHSHSRRGFAPG